MRLSVLVALSDSVGDVVPKRLGGWAIELPEDLLRITAYVGGVCVASCCAERITETCERYSL